MPLPEDAKLLQKKGREGWCKSDDNLTIPLESGKALNQRWACVVTSLAGGLVERTFVCVASRRISGVGGASHVLKLYAITPSARVRRTTALRRFRVTVRTREELRHISASLFSASFHRTSQENVDRGDV
jgi:hypothetical protein